MAREPRIVTIDGDRYQLTVMPAGKAIRLLSSWHRVEAAMQDAAADAVALERSHRIPEWLGQQEPDPRIEAANVQERARRIEAAVLRAQADHLLTPDAVTGLLLPMLGSVQLVLDRGMVPLVGVEPVWESHFAGRLQALLQVVDAAKQHNFSDFFGGLASEPDAEPEASQGSKAEPPTAGSASSGRPSVRVSPPATRKSATSGPSTT